MRFQRLVVCFCAAVLLMTSGCDSSSQQTSTTAPTSTAVPSTTLPAPTIPVRVPETLGTMEMGTVFYKPKQASTVFSVNIEKASSAEVAALRCLQGLVARTSSGAVYLQSGEDDAFWRDYTESEYGLLFKDFTAEQLFQKYADSVKSFVVYDEKRAYEFPIAQSLASAQDGLAVTEELLTQYAPYFSEDIKITRLSSVCKDESSAMKWAVENVLPLCEKQYIGIVGQEDAFNDYLYAVKAFTVSVSKNTKKTFLEAIGDAGYQEPGIVFQSGVDLTGDVGSAGFGTIECTGFANATFFASFPNSNRDFSQPNAVDKKALDGRIYVSIVLTDDNLLLSQRDLVNRLINPAVRGNTPVGFAVNPSLSELAPAIFKWYQQNRASNTLFVSTDGGYCAIDEASFKSDALVSWQLTNRHFLDDSGLSILNLTSSDKEDTLVSVLDALNRSGYLCKGMEDSALLAGKPAIAVRELLNLEDISDFKLPAEQTEARFVCLFVPISELGEQPYQKLDELVTQYQTANPERVEFLLPNDLCKTFLQYSKQHTTATSPSSQPSSQTGTTK